MQTSLRSLLAVACVLVLGTCTQSHAFFEYMDDPDAMATHGLDACYATTFCDLPVLTGDGHTVTFVATFFSPFQGEARFRYDIPSETTIIAPDVRPSGLTYGYVGDVTDDDVYVAFSSSDDIWAPNDTNGASDVFVFDPNYTNVFGHNERVSVTSAGAQAFGTSEQASLSSAARYVAFQTNAALVPGDTNGFDDVYLRDRVAGTTELVSVAPFGGVSPGGADLSYPGRHMSRTMSLDASAVAFIGGCDLLPGGCPAGQTDAILLRNRTLGVTQLVSKSLTGEPRLGIRPSISADGSKIVYTSDKDDIVAGDTHPGCDLFVYDRTSDSTLRVPLDGFESPCSYDAVVSNDGHVVFSMFAGILLWANCPAIAPVCGDGHREAACEECDDGNLVDGDGCDSNCTPTACGNGITTAGEECDDGNFVDGDGCDSNCTVTACGNGIRTAGEACEDGNTTAGDGCSPTCQIEPDQLTAGGKGKSDCIDEMLPQPQPPKPDGVFPAGVLTCKDDDPSCDFGPAGDHTCHFEVAYCLNVTDPRLDCTPRDVAAIEIVKPKYNDYTELGIYNHGQLSHAFTQFGFEDRHCIAPAGAVGTACAINDDCGAGGKCGKPDIEPMPAVTTPGLCTPYATIDVPLKLKKGVYATGKGQVAIRMRTSPDGAGKVALDTDKLKLVCNP